MPDMDDLIARSSLGTPQARKLIDEAPIGMAHNQRLIDEAERYEREQVCAINEPDDSARQDTWDVCHDQGCIDCPGTTSRMCCVNHG